MNRITTAILLVLVALVAGAWKWYKSGREESGTAKVANPRQLRGSYGKSVTPTLDLFARDLSAQAKMGQLDPVIGRDTEIERVIQILSRRTKNNPLLLGEPGVGKTAIAEGLARKIAAGEVTTTLQNKRVLALDVTGLISGTKYRGEFEKRLKRITDEITAANRSIILFIDEVHTLVQSQGSEGAINPADIFKPALARGELQAIGATTEEEYRKYIVPEKALERRFQPVYIGEPSLEATAEILRGLRPVYEKHHRVKISDEAIAAAVALSDQYIHDRYLPDKAIDLIDEGAAKAKLDSVNAQMRLVHEASVQNGGVAPDASVAASVDPTVAAARLPGLQTELAQLQAEAPQVLDLKALKHLYERTAHVQQQVALLEGAIREREAETVWPVVQASDIERIVMEWAEATRDANTPEDRPGHPSPSDAAPEVLPSSPPQA